MTPDRVSFPEFIFSPFGADTAVPLIVRVSPEESPRTTLFAKDTEPVASSVILGVDCDVCCITSTFSIEEGIVYYIQGREGVITEGLIWVSI